MSNNLIEMNHIISTAGVRLPNGDSSSSSLMLNDNEAHGRQSDGASSILDDTKAHGRQSDGAASVTNDSKAAPHSEFEFEMMADRMAPPSSSSHDEARMRMPSSPISDEQQQRRLRFNGRTKARGTTRG